MTRQRCIFFSLITCALLVGGCDDTDDAEKNPVEDGGLITEAGTDTCTYEGQTYQTGDIFCAADGCNSCQCNPEESSGVSCSVKNCDDPNVVVAEVCQPGDTCTYEGQTYQTGDIFCAADGCNSCQCNPEGSSGVGCSMKDCSDPEVVVAEVCQ